MNRINQILQISSIDGAMQIKEMINGWSNAEIIQFHRELMELNKNGNESDKKTYTTCDDRNENCKNRSEASVCLKHLNEETRKDSVKKCECVHSSNCRYEQVILENNELCRHKE